MEKYGVVDIGSNTVRWEVYDVNEHFVQLFFKKKEFLGLANYVDKKVLSQAGIDRTIEVLNDYIFKDTVNAKEPRSDGKYYEINLDQEFDSHKFQMYYDPDYLVRVFFDDVYKKDESPSEKVENKDEKTQVEKESPKENPQSQEKMRREEEPEGFFKKLWKKLFG